MRCARGATLYIQRFIKNGCLLLLMAQVLDLKSDPQFDYQCLNIFYHACNVQKIITAYIACHAFWDIIPLHSEGLTRHLGVAIWYQHDSDAILTFMSSVYYTVLLLL